MYLRNFTTTGKPLKLKPVFRQSQHQHFSGCCLSSPFVIYPWRKFCCLDKAVSLDYIYSVASHKPTRRFLGTNATNQDRDSSTAFDSYLPRNLRLPNGLVGTKETEAVRPIQSLIEKLLKDFIDSSWKIEPLSQLGLHQNRWHAFMWLFKEILVDQKSSLHHHGLSPLNGWARGSLPLNQLSSDRLLPEKITQRQSLDPLELSLDRIVERPQLTLPSDGLITTLDPVGYLWMCLGSTIIQTVNIQSEAAASVMANVYQAIGLMHHYDVIPHTIYNYGPVDDASAIQRPPTLLLLQARILTTISDAVWTTSEAQILEEAQAVGAKYTHKGYELPGAEYRPRVRSMGLEVWLEFVLWSCVESGRISHASWIINQLINGEQGGTPWSAVSWDTLQCQIKFGDANSENLAKRFIGAASTVEGYSEESPPIVMGARTISKEVVQAIFDGLHSILNNERKDAEQMFLLLLENMKNCRKLLEMGKAKPVLGLWDQTLLRVSEGLNRDIPVASGFLSGVLSSHLDRGLEQKLATDVSLPDQSSATVGFMHLAFQAHIDLGLLNGSLQVFQRILGIADSSPAKANEDFFQKSPNELQQRGGLPLAELQQSEDFRYTAITQIPDRTLASFLGLLSDLRLHHLGCWLLAFQDIDGPIVSEEKYKSAILQPALLQFAAKASDIALLSKVATNLPMPLSNENTVALLQCQVAVRQWDRVHDILENALSKGFVMPLSVISHIARKIIIDEHSQLDDRLRASSTHAEAILGDLIRGRYDRNPSDSKSRSFLRGRQLNQMSRILTSVPGRLTTTISRFAKFSGQTSAITMIDSNAFEFILDGVVQASGPSAGMNFWQKWCIPPGSNTSMPYSQNGQERVVRPTVRTLNYILASLASKTERYSYQDRLDQYSSITNNKPIEGEIPIMTQFLHERIAHVDSTKVSQEAYSILSWAASVLRDFGLHEKTIAAELAIYMPHRSLQKL